VTEPLPEVVVAASRLRAAIEATAAALAGADPERLLACDALLQDALKDIPRSASLTREQRLMLQREAEDAQAALRRCRHLGSSLTDFVRCTLDVQGLGLGYEPGRTAARALTGRGFNERA
jgi:hypothetical protein